MVHAFLTPRSQTVTLELPESYIGKRVEFIAFATDEGDEVNVMQTHKPTFTVVHVKDANFKFDRDEANER